MLRIKEEAEKLVEKIMDSNKDNLDNLTVKKVRISVAEAIAAIDPAFNHVQLLDDPEFKAMIKEFVEACVLRSTVHESDIKNKPKAEEKRKTSSDKRQASEDSEDSREQSTKKKSRTTLIKKKTSGKRQPVEVKAKKSLTPEEEDKSKLIALGRAMNLGPILYKGMKDMDIGDQIQKLKKRLWENGATFKHLPTTMDISEAQKITDKKRDLDGLDTSLIISNDLPRGSRRQRNNHISILERPKYREQEDSDDEVEF